MATHSSVIACRTPGMAEPSGLLSMGSHRVGHDWSDLAAARSILWRRQWHPTPVLLPGKSHGWRSLVGCSLWGREESDTIEQHHFPFSLTRIGEGNGTPLQYSCLENPRDGGAWWAAIYGVAQSRTPLKQLSSSSSSRSILMLPLRPSGRKVKKNMRTWDLEEELLKKWLMSLNTGIEKWGPLHISLMNPRS